MEMLCCSHCGLEKEFKFFHSWKRDVKCQSCYSREYKEKHPEKVKMFQKNWKKNNLEKVLSSNKKSYQLHRKKRIAGSLDYQKRNIEKIRQNKVSWREKNKEKMSAYEKEYYLKNRDEILRKKAETNRNRRNRVILAKDDYKKIEQIKKSSASWKERNKDKVYTCNKEYYLKNREYILKKQAEYRLEKKRVVEQLKQKPLIDDFEGYVSWEKNELEEIMKIILRKCDKCGDMLAMRHFAGKSTTCRKCVDPVQCDIYFKKQKEKNDRFLRNNPEKTTKQYYENRKNNIEHNKNFDSEHFYMLFSKDNFEFNFWAKSNGIDLSFLPSIGNDNFLELIEQKDIEEQNRKKELLKKYRKEKAADIREYQREWYNEKKTKNEINNNHIPDIRNMVSSS